MSESKIGYRTWLVRRYALLKAGRHVIHAVGRRVVRGVANRGLEAVGMSSAPRWCVRRGRA